MRAVIPSVKISAICGVVPAEISYFDDEVGNYKNTEENSKKLKKIMGYGEHRVVLGAVTTFDMACFGINKLIALGELDLEGVGAIIFVSQTPEYILPSTSSCVHGAFKFRNDTYCVDINDGCCGYIRGLFEAAALIQSSDIDKVLLIAGDVLSPLVSSKDRNSYPLLGDAVTLSLVESDADADPISFELYSDGSKFDSLIIPAGGARLRSNVETSKLVEDDDGNQRSLNQLKMKGRDVFSFTQTVVPRFIKSFLKNNQVDVASVDALYLHQANLFIIDRIAKSIQIDRERVPDLVVRRYGNSSSATIPLSIALSDKYLPSRKVVACGFGGWVELGGGVL